MMLIRCQAQYHRPNGIRPKSLFHTSWPMYHCKYEATLTPHIVSIVEKMMRCCEPSGGYHKYQCPKHPEHTRVVPHTCKTRICSTCATIQNDIWGEQMKQVLPKGDYFHVTLTMPQEFRDFFGKDDSDWIHKNNIYSLGWQVINGYFKNQHHTLTGCLMVLHTFGRALNVNPHLHIIVPAGGLNEKRITEWKKVPYIAQEYLSKAWKNNLLQYVLEHHHILGNHVTKIMKLLKQKKLKAKKQLITFINNILPETERDKWMHVIDVDYYTNASKKTDFNQTVAYVARYTRRLPVAKTKITYWDPKNEILTWEYQPHNEKEPVANTMHAHQFIDKIVQHIPPKNFRMVRYCGIFASKNKPKFDPILKKICQFDTPKKIPSWRERQFHYTGEDPLICPRCKKEMQLVEKATWIPELQGIKFEVVPKK